MYFVVSKINPFNDSCKNESIHIPRDEILKGHLSLKVNIIMKMRCFMVDTLATIIFFTVIAACTELFIAGMDPSEVFITRLIMIPMIVLTARPYAIWRDCCFKWAQPNTRLYKTVIDALAFMSFQLPIYIITLAIAGADVNEIISLVISSSLLMLMVSRPFGIYLEYIRRYFKVTSIKQC